MKKNKDKLTVRKHTVPAIETRRIIRELTRGYEGRKQDGSQHGIQDSPKMQMRDGSYWGVGSDIRDFLPIGKLNLSEIKEISEVTQLVKSRSRTWNQHDWL